jgi:putative spermidine/putrescine transport system permease protein
VARATALRRGTEMLLAALFAAPLLVLVVQAFANEWRAPAIIPTEFGTRGFEAAFGQGNAAQALVNSTSIALLTTGLALIIGWPAARALGHKRARQPAVIILVALPLLIPPFATGTGLAEWFIRLGIADTIFGVALAHLTAVLPYVVLILALGFTDAVTELEDVARTFGAGFVRRLAFVTVPTVATSLATASLLAFLVSWAQYGTSLAVGGGLPTLPVALLPYVRTDAQVAAALSLLMVVPAVLTLLIALRKGRRTL